jgi:hypothetical protein
VVGGGDRSDVPCALVCDLKFERIRRGERIEHYETVRLRKDGSLIDISLSVSHGALSNQTGWVHISWSVLQRNGDNQFSFRWQEREGPPVEPPTIKGFGAVILEQVMAEYFDVPPKIEFVPSGVCYELKGPVEAVTMKLH